VVQKISPCLWFSGNAEEAMNLYVSVFKNSKVIDVSRYGDAGPGPSGTVMAVTFELDGVEFMGLNAEPEFPFTEAVSFYVKCETQQEIDELWDKLIADGGQPSQCGWLKDKFGVSWQIIPNALGRLLGDPDPARAQRTMQAMLQMQKLDIATLEQA
jgi:predicted 3-demethylubiquinone-9 3-methyltransferase (glyoxalase superfamily)